MNIKENYQQYVSRYASEVAALKRKNTGFITGELLAFGGILAFHTDHAQVRQWGDAARGETVGEAGGDRRGAHGVDYHGRPGSPPVLDTLSLLSPSL